MNKEATISINELCHHIFNTHIEGGGKGAERTYQVYLIDVIKHCQKIPQFKGAINKSDVEKMLSSVMEKSFRRLEG